MRLKRIELTNYRQHGQLDVDFSGNMIAVLGANGSGKSNFLGAIQFALTGEQPPYKKEDLTKWGEKEGSVRLVFTAGQKNREFVLTRKTGGDATLSIEGETEKIKGAKKISDVLRDAAGIDKELLKQIVFVPQKGIDAILFDDPRVREVSFQRLIGIGEASRIYETLRGEIAAYDRPSSFNEAIAKAKDQLSTYREQLAACKKSLGRYEEVMKALPAKYDLQKTVDGLVAARSVVDEFSSIRSQLKTVQEEHERSLAEMAADRYVPPEEGEEDELRRRLNDAATQVAYLNRLKELCDNVAACRGRSDAANKALGEFLAGFTDIDAEKARMASLESDLAAARAELRHLESLGSEDSANGECPLCGSKVEPGEIARHVSGKVAELEALVSKLEGELSPLSARIREFESGKAGLSRAADREKAAYDSALAALVAARDKNVEGVVIDVDSLSFSYNGKTVDDVESIDEARVAARRRLDEIASMSRSHADKMAAINRQTARIDVLKGREADLARKMADSGMDPSADAEKASLALGEKVAAARENLSAYEDIVNSVAGEKGRMDALAESVESTESGLRDLEEKQKLDDALQERVGALKRSREWFHYREGPRIMSQNVMHCLCGWVNDFLDQFCAPFVVEAEEEGFGFRCRFIDGRAMPEPFPDASMLSGGQKVMLAIAFRMAIYMRYGGELGLLSLDEPTAYLDDASIEHLGGLLTKVGQIARNRGLQILMATHEKAIMPFMDTQIIIGERK